jgi:hypothetical protein
MKNRVKDLYLEIGRVLNNPKRFGLAERMPKPLVEVLTKIQLELMEELREGGVEEDFFVKDFLSDELSQDADGHAFRGVTSTSFELPKTRT